MSKVLNEITPLSEKDCFYIVERHKSEFLFPLHTHEEYELNFIEHGKGVRRIVGDSVEEIGNYELTLVAGGELAHAWEQGRCTEPDVREITIQFSPQLFTSDMLARNQFSSIKKMLDRARLGLNFSMGAIMKVYSRLDTLATTPDRFDQFLHFLKILYDLSLDADARTLASSSYAQADQQVESRRIKKVKDYIAVHYADQVRLEEMALLAGMILSLLGQGIEPKRAVSAAVWLRPASRKSATAAASTTFPISTGLLKPDGVTPPGISAPFLPKTAYLYNRSQKSINFRLFSICLPYMHDVFLHQINIYVGQHNENNT